MVRGRGRRYRRGRRRIRSLKTTVSASAALADERLDCTVGVYVSEESEERGRNRGEAPKVRAVKSSEFGERKM